MEIDVDKRFGKALEISDPSDQWIGVSPHATDALPNGKPNYIYIGEPGDLVCAGDDGDDVTFAALTVGFHPIRPKYIRSASTAASIVACY